MLLKSVVLVADVMFVNGLPFFVTMSRNIRLYTVEHIPSRSVKQLSRSLTKILKTYGARGFVVTLALMDREFAPREEEFLGLVNCTAAREHVGEVERGEAAGHRDRQQGAGDQPFGDGGHFQQKKRLLN